MSTHFKNKAAPSRIIDGNTITAGQAAANAAGIPMHQIIQMIKARVIFGVCIDGFWYVSKTVLPELHRVAESLQHRTPIQQPEFYAQGGIS